MTCTRCGGQTGANATFCGTCGAPLSGAAKPGHIEPQEPEVAPVGAVASPARAIAATHDAVTVAPATTVATATRRHAGRWSLRWAIALLAVLIAGGVVAARAITVTLLSSHGAMADLLPASTVLYAGINLDPSGSQGDNLRTIEHAFTSQPGWSHVQQTIDTALASSGKGSGSQTDWKSLLNITDRRFAIAVTDASALMNTTADSRAVQNAVVVIIGLMVQASLADIVTSHHIGIPNKLDTYHGVDLYRISSSLSTGEPAYGAILNGYAVICATEAGLTREIDVQQGRSPRLSDSARYKQLAHQITTDGIVFAYVDTPALLAAEPGSSLATALTGVASAAAGSQMTALRQHLGAMGLAVSAQTGGLDLLGVAITTGTQPGSVTPDHAAQALPAGTLTYLSFDNLLATYRTEINQLVAFGTIRKSDYNQIENQAGDALNLLDSEFAVGLLPTDFQAVLHLTNDNTSSLPLAAMIDVSRHPDAQAIVQHLLGRFFPKDPQPLGLRHSATARGNALYSTHAGYGYALIKNWLVISPAISRVASDLEGVLYGGQPSLAASDPFQQAQNTLQGARNMVMLVNLAAVRAALETGLLPTVSPHERQQYEQDARPLLAPLRMLAIRAGEAGDGSSAGTELFVGIGP